LQRETKGRYRREVEEERKERGKNSGENQNRVGFSKSSFPPLFFPVFSPSQILLFGEKWVRHKGVINNNFTVAVGMGERSKKGGFKEMLAVSQREAPC